MRELRRIIGTAFGMLFLYILYCILPFLTDLATTIGGLNGIAVTIGIIGIMGLALAIAGSITKRYL